MRGSWIGIAAAVAALIVGLVIGRGTSPAPVGRPASADPPPSAPSKGKTPPPPLVGVANPKRVTIQNTLSLTANIASLKTAVIYSKTAGYLEAVTVRPGDPVRTGQVVAVVDHAQLDAQLSQAQATLLAAQSGIQTAKAAVATAHAQLASARAGVVKARAQLQDAEATESRIATLVRQGAVAQQSLDDATAQTQSARASLEAADAQVTAAREQENAAGTQVRTQEAQAASQAAAFENARLAVTNATIVAPFDGIVVSRNLDPGAYVTPGTSTPIITIAAPDQIDVVVNVTEVQIANIRRGAPVQIVVDAYPDRTFRGVVNRIAGGADPATRTVQVEIDIPNPGHLLRPGMYATARLSAGADKDVLVVPLGALVTVGDQHFVWVVKDDVVSKRPVTIGRATGEVVEVTSGLTEGDQIVARGADLVREGRRVRAVSVGGL